MRTQTRNTTDAVIERPNPSFGALHLPLKLDTPLPAPDLSVPVLELKTVSVQAPPLKDFYSDGELDARITPLVRVPPVYPIIAKKGGSKDGSR